MGLKLGSLGLLVLVAGEAAAATTTDPFAGTLTVPALVSSCIPDAPHGGLLAALKKRAEELPSGEEARLELEAAATLIDSYTAERQALCRELDAGAVAIAAVRQQRDGWRQVYESEVGTSSLYRERWQQALKSPVAGGIQRRLIACGPGGGVTYEEDATLRARLVLACIVPIFPR
ncbi:MAG TPA: hypothetical protein VGK94_08010 [Candidatus Polarisedimenticolia bacterium]